MRLLLEKGVLGQICHPRRQDDMPITTATSPGAATLWAAARSAGIATAAPGALDGDVLAALYGGKMASNCAESWLANFSRWVPRVKVGSPKRRATGRPRAGQRISLVTASSTVTCPERSRAAFAIFSKVI